MPTFTVILILEYGLMAPRIFVSLYVITLGFVSYIRFFGVRWKNLWVTERSYAGVHNCLVKS
jgi:hypothetical protein